MTTPARWTRLLITAWLATASATALAGSGEYPLPWPNAGEVLMYRSCGCADACWVAEVRQRRTHQPLARLRCDCSTLSYSSNGRAPDRPLNESCEAINQGPDKAESIRRKIESLREAPNASVPVHR
jgi:hypothetical protein